MTLTEPIAAPEKAEGPSCVIWPRAKDDRGRGRIWHDGKLMLAHRWVWERSVGRIPAGALLCHHCDNPSCVNIAHLYVGTHKTNAQDMGRRGRQWLQRDLESATRIGRALGGANDWAKGARNPKAKLSENSIAIIRADGRKTSVLAEEFGVDRTTIQRIRRGALWP